MQWFTEFMELFLSVGKLIKTLNLYFVCIFAHNPESLLAQKEQEGVLWL